MAAGALVMENDGSAGSPISGGEEDDEFGELMGPPGGFQNQSRYKPKRHSILALVVKSPREAGEVNTKFQKHGKSPITPSMTRRNPIQTLNETGRDGLTLSTQDQRHEAILSEMAYLSENIEEFKPIVARIRQEFGVDLHVDGSGSDEDGSTGTRGHRRTRSSKRVAYKQQVKMPLAVISALSTWIMDIGNPAIAEKKRLEADVSQEFGEMAAKMESLAVDNESLAQMCDSFRRDNEELNDEISRLEDEIQMANEMRQKKEEGMNQMLAMHGDANELEMALQQSQEMQMAMEQDLIQTREENDQLQGEIESVSAIIESKDAYIRRLEMELGRYEEKMQAIEQTHASERQAVAHELRQKEEALQRNFLELQETQAKLIESETQQVNGDNRGLADEQPLTLGDHSGIAARIDFDGDGAGYYEDEDGMGETLDAQCFEYNDYAYSDDDWLSDSQADEDAMAGALSPVPQEVFAKDLSFESATMSMEQAQIVPSKPEPDFTSESMAMAKEDERVDKKAESPKPAFSSEKTSHEVKELPTKRADIGKMTGSANVVIQAGASVQPTVVERKVIVPKKVEKIVHVEKPPAKKARRKFPIYKRPDPQPAPETEITRSGKGIKISTKTPAWVKKESAPKKVYKSGIVYESAGFGNLINRWKKTEVEKGGVPQAMRMTSRKGRDVSLRPQRIYRAANMHARVVKATDSKAAYRGKRKIDPGRTGGVNSRPIKRFPNKSGNPNPAPQALSIVRMTKTKFHTLKPRMTGSLKIIKSSLVPESVLKRHKSFFFAVDGLPTNSNVKTNEDIRLKDRSGDKLSPAMFYFFNERDYRALTKEAGSLNTRSKEFQAKLAQYCKGIFHLDLRVCAPTQEECLEKLAQMSGKSKVFLPKHLMMPASKGLAADKRRFFIVGANELTCLEAPNGFTRARWMSTISKLISKRKAPKSEGAMTKAEKLALLHASRNK